MAPKSPELPELPPVELNGFPVRYGDDVTVTYAAFNGKLGGEVYVVSAADGTVEQKLKIAGEPVFNGMAATPGRLFLALRTGTVVGLTSKGSMP